MKFQISLTLSAVFMLISNANASEALMRMRRTSTGISTAARARSFPLAYRNKLAGNNVNQTRIGHRALATTPSKNFESLETIPDLSLEARSALEAAATSGHFSVKVVSRKNGQNYQSAILVGELHIKDKLGSDLGKNLMSHFNLIGVEGVSEVSASAGAFLEKLYKLAGLLSTEKDLSYQSTITDIGARYGAEQKERSEKEKEAIRRIVHSYEKDPFTFKYTDLKVAEQDENLKSFLLSLGYQEDSVIYGNKLVDLVKKTRAHLFSDRLEVIPLEAFDPPSKETQKWQKAMERSYRALQTTGLLVSSGVFLTPVCITQVIPDIINSDVLKAIALTSMSTMAYSVKTFIDSGKIDLIKPRDKVMAKRISGALAIRPNAKVMLALFGKSHMAGMVKYLVEDHGFWQVPLLDQDYGSHSNLGPKSSRKSGRKSDHKSGI